MSLIIAAFATQAFASQAQSPAQVLIESLNQLYPSEQAKALRCENQTVTATAEGPIINDSRVIGLNCSKLTPQNVLTYLDHQKMDEHIKMLGTLAKNFPGGNGLIPLNGHCWAISTAYRKLIFLTELDPSLKLPQSTEQFRSESFERRRRFLDYLNHDVKKTCSSHGPPGKEVNRCQPIEHDPLEVLSFSAPEELRDFGSFLDMDAPAKYDAKALFFVPDSYFELSRKYANEDEKARFLQGEQQSAKVFELANRIPLRRIELRKKLESEGKSEDEIIAAIRNAKFDEEVELQRMSDETAGKLKDAGYQLGPTGKTTSLRTQLKDLQWRLLMKSANLKYLKDDNRRPTTENNQTAAQLMSEVTQGRMPMLNVRFSRFAQHILLVKSFKENSDGSIDFVVSDSNSIKKKDVEAEILGKLEKHSVDDLRIPPPDRILKFKNGDFEYSPIDFDPPKTTKVGAFITNSEEMDQIQQALYRHYQRKCDAAAGRHTNSGSKP